ncbi:alpha-hydroxyketone-type quorum-sensing autoinducer synthase [Pseudomonas fluorescens]|uniref:CAI-1 autoinducer synthase n=1 Tax=Pseudomonas fluorescens TaxID=294 RepID=A0A5E7ECW4_PSEFL|nr:alpha-hydroxyketone-type quorum-sensing autoinducer synthase [Pseudomonas fluorescens]VVO24841.1 CAI-1 autoinducer synthase [Pseudomonas fluorescens]VVP96581.1 CAI-1 autoinducer synthase [Pseudomonas fluorescens]
MPVPHQPPQHALQQTVSAVLPDFVQARIESHTIGRIQQRWAGQHLLRGAFPGPDALHLSSNDYLCLANERHMIEAQARAILQTRHQLLMSAVFLQGDTPIARLEQHLAQFIGAQDSILCQSGWAANVGLMQAIAGPYTPVYLDIHAHMSFWQGAHAAHAHSIAFAHNDAAHAERQIKKHGQGVIAVDAIYSTNGSLCPLTDFADIAQRNKCVLVVDESHSLGTHGAHGAGLVAQNQLFDKVHFQTVSLAKAFAGRAGLITCPGSFKDYFAMESYPAIFSSSLLDHELTWFEQAADFLQHAEERRRRLHAITYQVRAALTQLGYDVSAGTEQIIALEPGPELLTLRLRDALQARGIFGSAFCAPATGLNRSLMRFSMNCGLTDEELDHLIRACSDIRDEVSLKRWRRSSAAV